MYETPLKNPARIPGKKSVKTARLFLTVLTDFFPGIFEWCFVPDLQFPRQLFGFLAGF